MVEGASWFGVTLLPQGLDSLLSSTEKWIPRFINTFCRRMSGYLSANWNSTEVGWCNRTTTENTEVNQQQNGFNRSHSEHTPFGVAQSESWPQPDWDAVAWPRERVVHTRHPKNIAELKQFFKEEWSKIPLDRCVGLIQKLQKLQTVCLLLWPRWRSDPIWWPIYADIQVFQKGSHHFSCHCSSHI